MVGFTGRLGWKQYLPLKPTKRGIKVWMRANPYNGFAHEIQIYTGRQGNVGPEVNLSSRVVKDLTSSLKGKFHHIYCDNFFSSPQLFLDLYRDGLLACGTVRMNRKGLPKSMSTQGVANLKTPGDSCSRQAGPLVATSWRDKRVVHLLSTNVPDPTATTTVRRKQRDGSVLDVACPPAIPLYNQHMSGVDHADQLRAA
jgi:hypothetical protein